MENMVTATRFACSLEPIYTGVTSKGDQPMTPAGRRMAYADRGEIDCHGGPLRSVALEAHDAKRSGVAC